MTEPEDEEKIRIALAHASKPIASPAVLLLRYAPGDRVELMSGCWYPGQVVEAFVTGENVVTPTYVVALDGCTGAITVTEHRLLRKAGETDG